MAATRITFQPNGSMRVEGDFELVDAAGQPIPLAVQRVSLCRCGQSANKPFCDGSHRAHGFVSTIVAAETRPPAPKPPTPPGA